jgi:DNA-binding MltR family transcriptional regulator
MTLNDFLLSPVAEVKDLAERAVNLKLAYSLGKLSNEEYMELVDDLLTLKHINEASISIETSRELWNIVDFLKNLKFMASII